MPMWRPWSASSRRSKGSEEESNASPDGKKEKAGKKARSSSPAKSRGQKKSQQAASPPKPPEPQPEPATPSDLEPGTRVVISGLQNARELNGRSAIVFSFEHSRGRYIVELEDGGGQKGVRPQNLTSKGEATGAVAAKARAASANASNAAARDRKFEALDSELSKFCVQEGGVKKPGPTVRLPMSPDSSPGAASAGAEEQSPKP
mmetsp:Transcript_18789/g.47112  ORF Transcript_18789/g.47112 Transcript_18789/m.47112 type:complete len:204 (+) Transcript_18789:45-656(+)